MNYSKDRQERNVLEKEYFDETLRRLKEVTGDKFNAGHGINHEKKDGEHNAKYIAAPSQEQIWQYNMIVDMSQVEIDDTHLMLKTKEMDIDGYKKESEKFLEQNRGRLAWDTYELQLAQERVLNQRLRTNLLKKNGNDVDQLIDEASQAAYDEYNSDSQFKLAGEKKFGT